MKHYALHDWLDYLHERIVEDRKRKAMKAHLKSGCATCTEAVAFCRHVRDFVQREIDYEVPQSAVRHAKRAFAIAQKRSGIGGLIPRLSFDSLWDALPAGMRSSMGAERTLQYQLNTIQVRLRAENQAAPVGVRLDGQLVDESDEAKPLNDLQVFLVRGDTKLFETRTNQFGEFHLDFSPKPDIDLLVDTRTGREIVIPLAEFCTESDNREPRE